MINRYSFKVSPLSKIDTFNDHWYWYCTGIGIGTVIGIDIGDATAQPHSTLPQGEAVPTATATNDKTAYLQF